MYAKKYLFLWITVTIVTLAGCKKQEFLYQDITSRIWLGRIDADGGQTVFKDSSVSSFLLKPATAQKDTLYITANVTGVTAGADRPFSLQVVPQFTNVTPADYTILPAIMPANSFTAQVPVVVNKNVTGLNLARERAVLTVHFVANANFGYAAQGRDTFRVIWYNFLPRPDGWSAVQSFIGNFSQAKYKFILDFFGPLDFERYRGNTNLGLGLQSALKKTLRDYNANPANQGRPEGWPYLNDDGTPLSF